MINLPQFTPDILIADGGDSISDGFIKVTALGKITSVNTP